MAARGALLDCLSDKNIFRRLYSRLLIQQVQSDASKDLQEHCQKVGTALKQIIDNNTDTDNKKETDSIVYNIISIEDSFFVNSSGDNVQNADYAFCEIVGDTGTFYNSNVRLGISWQSEDLVYLGHHHLAQELYFVLEGECDWWTDSIPTWETRNQSWHLSNEHHAMKTGTGPALFFWSWTGELELNVKHSPKEIQTEHQPSKL